MSPSQRMAYSAYSCTSWLFQVIFLSGPFCDRVLWWSSATKTGFPTSLVCLEIEALIRQFPYSVVVGWNRTCLIKLWAKVFRTLQLRSTPVASWSHVLNEQHRWAYSNMCWYWILEPSREVRFRCTPFEGRCFEISRNPGSHLIHPSSGTQCHMCEGNSKR